MKKWILGLIAVSVGVALAQGPGRTPSSSPGASSSQPLRPIGVVTQIKPGTFTLHTDAGPDVVVLLPDEVPVLRISPGAKNLEGATKITVGDISPGDRVLVRGRASDDQKSLLATSVIVMAKTDLEKAREAERLEWRQHGLGGLVKGVDPAKKEITISVPNVPPTPGNPSRPAIISLSANTVLLRYAPDSVKFSDAKPSSFEEIKVGDQLRALGTRSDDGSRFAAEKLVSGAFRNLGAAVISVDPPNGTVTVKDLVSGKPVVVRTNPDSRLHRLPPFLAHMIAEFNSGGPPSCVLAGQPQSGGPRGGLRQEPPSTSTPRGPQGGGPGDGPGHGPPSRTMPGRPQAGGPEDRPGNGPPDLQQMMERTPQLALSELKAGDALIVVSTEGAKPSEITAIVVLAGVEPILAAQPVGSDQMVLGPWSMSMGEGEP